VIFAKMRMFGLFVKKFCANGISHFAQMEKMRFRFNPKPLPLAGGA
jgi:hypothetical protein